MAQHTVYDGVPIVGLDSAHDSEIPIRIGTLFYTFGPTTVGWRCRGARLYVPSSSEIPALVTFSLWVQPTITAATMATEPLRSATIDTAVGRDNWFEVTWDSVEVIPGQKFLVGYEAGHSYQFIPGSNGGSMGDEVQASDGSSLYLSEVTPDTRGHYYLTDGSGSGYFKFISGLDVILDDDSTAPSTPTGLAASVDGQVINLSWSASTDNVAVTGYRVYRSTSPGFTADSNTQIAQTGVVVANYDIVFSSGTYYYKLTAIDQAGNVSDASSEVSATVVVDGTGVYIFPSDLGWTPGVTTNDVVAAGQTLGTAFALTGASPILGARFYSPIATNNISLRLWHQATSTELLAKTGLSATAGWNIYLFDTSFVGSATEDYVMGITIGNSTQAYAARLNSFSLTRSQVGSVYSETDFNGLYGDVVDGMPTWSFQSSWYGIDVIVAAPPARTGQVKVWDGADWTGHTVKVWDGTQWQQHQVKGYDGDSYIVGK